MANPKKHAVPHMQYCSNFRSSKLNCVGISMGTKKLGSAEAPSLGRGRMTTLKHIPLYRCHEAEFGGSTVYINVCKHK